MKRSEIEKEVRLLHYEIWKSRDILFPYGVPPLQNLYDPRIAARILGLEYEERQQITSADGNSNFEAAGILNRRRQIISISTRFPYEVQRFTGAHEVGHFLLHPSIGGNTLHRDRPKFEYLARDMNRPQYEREADYFSACYLAPQELLIEEFEKRFGPVPLRLDETVAFHLKGDLAHQLFISTHGSLDFPAAVASAQKFDRLKFPSLARSFGMSISAMAIRLRELKLVIE
jgi:IrrE N-terminal-like domain